MQRLGKQEAKPSAFREKASRVVWVVAGREWGWVRGEVVIRRLGSWGFFLRAVGSHGGSLNREVMASDVRVQK